MATSCLQRGGRFVCKLYTSFSTATSSLLYLTTRMFGHVEIVKPMSSRVAGPERYLFASGFEPSGDSEAIRAVLLQAHQFGKGASPLQAPMLTPIVSLEELSKDSDFLSTLQGMVSQLSERQTGSLNAIVDLAEELEDIAG